MCLYYSAKETAKLKRKKGSIICKKAYIASDGKLLSPLMGNCMWALPPFQKGAVVKKAGVIQSTRKSSKLTEQERKTKEINYGIHVYLKNEYVVPGEVCVPVKCNIKDLVGAGAKDGEYGWEAVFTKVSISKKDFEKAIGK